jgi:hypothetical protein
MEAAMATMGFPVDFDTTKGKKVKGNVTGAVNRTNQVAYRQYMNRKTPNKLIEGGTTR